MADKKGAKEVVKKKSYSIHTAYKVEGDKVIRNNKNCPKCGPGVFLGKHKNRLSCGKCNYSERL